MATIGRPTSEDLLPYARSRSELSVQHGCLLWDSRVVIPPSVRDKAMERLHETNPGVSKMKSLARQYVWWPGMDADLERRVKNCASCQSCWKDALPPPPLCTSPSVGVASAALVQSTCRLCWALPGEDVPHHH